MISEKAKIVLQKWSVAKLHGGGKKAIKTSINEETDATTEELTPYEEKIHN